MATIRSMLPIQLQPYTEAVVGAALGALVGGYVVKKSATSGAIVGAIAGYGVMLTKKSGAMPFTAGYFTGAEEVVEQLPDGQDVVIPGMMPDWQRDWRRHGWHGWHGQHGWRR
jgi:outer membrane lipoprotein SlyB